MSGHSIGRRMLFVFALIALTQAIVAVIGLRGFSLSNDDLLEVYQERLVPVSQLARINDLMHVSIEQLTIAVIARPSPQNAQKYIDRVEGNLVEVDRLVQDYTKHVAGDEDKKLLANWTSKREALIGKGIKPAIAALKTQEFNDAEDTVLGVAVKQFAAVQQDFDAIVAKELKNAESTYAAADSRYGFTRYLTIGAVMFALGLCAIVALYVNRSVTKPLAAMTSAMRRLAKGELEIDIPATGRKDEIGDMAGAVEVFKQNAVDARRLAAEQSAEQERKHQRQAAVERHIETFEGAVRASLDVLGSAAAEMRTTSESMSSTAEETSAQAATVTTAGEQASSNVQAVASATEELSSSVAEIGRQVDQSTKVAGQAVGEASQSNATVQSLSEAAQKIGDVVKLISDIASQTNLLALNATIEAARAGEAGKGFAVVASEVKSLATQTAKATEEISAQIAAMQSATGGVVQTIQSIGATIGRMNEISTAIA
jgi:methyl-accepting chemotaxis protein